MHAWAVPLMYMASMVHGILLYRNKSSTTPTEQRGFAVTENPAYGKVILEPMTGEEYEDPDQMLRQS